MKAKFSVASNFSKKTQGLEMWIDDWKGIEHSEKFRYKTH